jgi:hypothetical protein
VEDAGLSDKVSGVVGEKVQRTIVSASVAAWL